MRVYQYMILGLLAWSTKGGQTCINDVDNVQQSRDNFISPDRTVIVPRLTFTCNGRITNIRVRISTHDTGTNFPYIQVWRQLPTPHLYSLVDGVQIQSSHLNNQSANLEANISLTGNNRIQFLSGDVIGFYNPPDTGYVLEDIRTDEYVYNVFVGSSASSQNLNNAIMSNRRQPLIQFTLDIQCNNLTTPSNGEIKSCSSGSIGVGYEGDTCSYTCNTGYGLAGSDMRTCQSNGSWSDIGDVCRRVPPPFIITHPTDTSAAAPFSAVFTCSARGHGLLDIKWYRSNVLYEVLPRKSVVNQTSTPEVTTSTLVIANVTNNDVGSYYCVVWAGRQAAVSGKVKLDLASPPIQPEVVVSTSLVYLNVNNFKLSMACVPNINGFTYKWEKKGDDLRARVKEVTSPTFVLDNLHPKDSGEYRCIVSNSTGKIVSKYKQIKVTVSPPDLILHPSSVTVSATGKAVFQCAVEGYGNIIVEWRKLDSHLPITATINNIKSLNRVTSTLEIRKSIGYYKGSYYCTASNDAGIVNSTVAVLNVSVQCAEIIRPSVFNEVLPGGTATFSCLAWSYSGLVYDWQKNDTLQLPSNAKQSFKRWSSSEDIGYTTYVYQLTVYNVQLSNEGSYCCLAINECGVTRSCAWLEVKTLPHIVKQPLSVSVKVSNNSKCVLEYLATGVGPIQYKWEKYQSSSNSWIRPSHRAVDITSPKLIFSVITEEAEGVYHCVVTNHDGSVVSSNATITVYGPPVINFITSKSVAFEGNKATLICNATNDVDATTSVSIDWYNSEGAKVESESKHRLVYNVTNPVSGQVQSVLLFDPVNHTDSGEYTCHAFNDNDCYTEDKTNLTVEYAPIITITPSSPFTASVGQQVTIICNAEGLPTPNVQWYINDKAVEKVANIPFQALVVPTATQHATVYTCVSTNNAGGVMRTTKANVSVTVQAMCPPLHDLINGHVSLQGGGQFAIFSCNLGYSLNGPFILWCSGGRWNPTPPACV